MRVLTQNEISTISGGMYCTDRDGFNKIASAATRDGMLTALFAAPVTGTVVYTIAAFFTPTAAIPIGLGVGVAAFSMPIYALIGRQYSNAWDIFD